MGVKDLWSILTPYAERKPIYELRGKTVAIDLAGWVCESLNVVDYFVHPKHHLKNLFFRTCYLIWEEVTPIFVLEGVAPKLKSQVIDKRNDLPFRGVKPNKNKGPTKTVNLECDGDVGGGQKSRTRFNHVLKECENLLRVMGIQCIQGPGEAEAYCAFLNQKGLVDGVISQDSDCFAYGAVRVYRNFSVSNQGALAAQGGAVDIYDMQQIRSKMDFGQSKVIAMALLCGCDYCPDGIGGVGRDSVLKLFNRYKDQDILQRLRNWRHENDKYTALEMRLDDKTICTNCGHIGRMQSHTKKGCGICHTQQGCDGSFWKEERLSLKAEVALRHKALADSMFPHEEIICEFLSQPTDLPELTLKWQKPNMINFIKKIGKLLEWTEIYCFQKFFPILTRWHVQNITRIKQMPSVVIHVNPKEIVKKRTVKGVPSLEIIWQDEHNFFNGLIPEEQLVEYQVNNPKGVTDLWTTVEPLNMMETSYTDIVTAFLKSKEKPKILKKLRKRVDANKAMESLENLNDLIAATEELAKTVKPIRVAKVRKQSKKGLQMIDKFFKEKLETPTKSNIRSSPHLQLLYAHCSTPLIKGCPSDLDSDAIDESAFNLSGIINNIVCKTEPAFTLTSHQGKPLRYEVSQNITERFINNHSKYFDDLDILKNKRNISNSFITSVQQQDVKRISLDDSFDVMVKMGNIKYSNINNLLPNESGKCFNMNESNVNATNVSYFFNSDYQDNDAFEKFMETSLLQSCGNKENDDGLIILSV